MITFELKSKHIHCKEASINPGHYPRMDGDPVEQIGWQVYGDFEPLGVPTVNLADYDEFPSPGCVFVKITPEYDGWLTSLIDAGLVEETGRILPAGLFDRYASECRVLKPELLEV